MGRLGLASPARAFRTASETAITAASWPITRLCRDPSIESRRSASSLSIRVTGIPVRALTTRAISSRPTVASLTPLSPSQRSLASLYSVCRTSASARNSAARS